MPKAILTLTVPDDVWIGALTRAHPDARIRVLSAIPSGATGVAIAELSARDPDAVVDEMRAVESVVDVHPLDASENRALLQLETRLPVLLDAARESGVPIEMPFTIRDGEVTWEVTAARDRLSDLGDQLEGFGVGFTLESVYHRVDADRFLSEQQWRVLEAAVDRGYYDTPRECTQYELADALGIARSTCSETLHRAEERVIKRFVDDESEPDSPTVAVGSRA